ncbi:hypothetical protein ABIB45_004619, partial [Arthrobacter sp. UYCo732]
DQQSRSKHDHAKVPDTPGNPRRAANEGTEPLLGDKRYLITAIPS